MDMDDLAQTAFSAFVDAAQWTMDPHQRLEAGSRAAAVAVKGQLNAERKAEKLANPGPIRVAKHGTYSGYSSGCRCSYCQDARRAYEGAFSHYDGNNSVRDNPSPN
jgi:hypothetical protein